MARCLCCGRGADPAEGDGQASPLDLTLLEAEERRVKIGFRAPRCGRGGAAARRAPSWGGRGAPAALECVVALLGGPYGDVLGPWEDRVAGVHPGERVTHEVGALHPGTEYTVTVSLAVPGSGGGEPTVLTQSVEVRTVDAASPLLSLEKGGKASDSLGCGGSSGSACGGGTPAGQAPSPVTRTASHGDASTEEPSEGGRDGDTEGRFEDSDTESENAPVLPEGSPAPAAVLLGREAGLRAADGPELGEASAPAAALGCRLCSMLDCLNVSRPPGAASPPGSTPVQRAPARAAEPPAAGGAPRRWTPYRYPFPGTEVDPFSVGLANLVEQNQEVFEAQLRRQQQASPDAAGFHI